MDKTNNEILRELYIEKLTLAKGNMSINDFCRRAGISSGNFSRMLKGQPAKPETLKKIADARPEIDYLYEELMYAAGYVNVPQGKGRLKSLSHNEDKGEMVAIPLLKTLKGVRSKIISANTCGFCYCNKSDLESDKSFVYCVADDGLAPHINAGDKVVFDSVKAPKDGDVVLLRINKEEGLVRYYRSIGTKIITYGPSRSNLPDIFSKNNVEIIGVATKALLTL